MARATAAEAAQTAQEILTTATTLFAEQGYAEVALEDVSLAAGVTRGAVYHHYGSKAGLFIAAARALQAGVADAVVERAESVGIDPANQLRAGCHAFIDAITSAPATRILLIDGPTVVGWDEWRRLDSENSGMHLREALQAIGTEEPLLDAMTVQLSGAMNEAAIWIAQQPDQNRARELAHRALDALLESVTT